MESQPAVKKVTRPKRTTETRNPTLFEKPVTRSHAERNTKQKDEAFVWPDPKPVHRKHR